MAVSGNVNCTFVSCLSCAGQAVLAVSTAGDGCARGPHLGAIRPAGERTACLLWQQADFRDPFCLSWNRESKLSNSGDVVGWRGQFLNIKVPVQNLYMSE